MRVHEAVKLKVSDIDFKSGTVYIKGKGGHERTVKIESKELLEKLKNLCTEKVKEAVIIARKRDKNQLTNEEFGKRAKEEIRGAAVNAGVDRNGKDTQHIQVAKHMHKRKWINTKVTVRIN